MTLYEENNLRYMPEGKDLQHVRQIARHGLRGIRASAGSEAEAKAGGKHT